MNLQKKSRSTVLLVAGFVFVGLVMISGCKREEPSPPAPSGEHDHEHDEAGHTHEHEETAMTAETKEVASTGEQTMCPIMDGNRIDKKYFTEYKGKKVYFCCPGCDAKFKEDPEKYLSKLPQFNQ